MPLVMEDTQHFLSDRAANQLQSLRYHPSAQRPFTNSVLPLQGNKPWGAGDMCTLKSRAMNVVLNSACVCVYVSRKYVRKWLTRRKDIWVKCALHLVNHVEMSFQKALCSKYYQGKCFVQKRYTHQMWEHKFPSDLENPPFTLLFRQAAVSSFFIHSQGIFQSVMNAKQDKGYSLTCQSSKEITLPLCECQVQCIHREGEMLLCHRRKHGFGCRAEEPW